MQKNHPHISLKTNMEVIIMVQADEIEAFENL